MSLDQIDTFEIEFAQTHQVNNDIFVEFIPPLSSDFTNMHDSLRIISVHVENRSIHNTCNISAIR